REPAGLDRGGLAQEAIARVHLQAGCHAFREREDVRYAEQTVALGAGALEPAKHRIVEAVASRENAVRKVASVLGLHSGWNAFEIARSAEVCRRAPRVVHVPAEERYGGVGIRHLVHCLGECSGCFAHDPWSPVTCSVICSTYRSRRVCASEAVKMDVLYSRTTSNVPSRS